ncbi:MAG: thioredoxin domain-containing protein [Arcobacteraceae bacterium]|nr:thioredoxin domain-containing protein [Arcobacteraceae bacterium]
MKISLMLKLLSLISLVTLSLDAKSIDEKVYSYEKHRIKSNHNIKLNSLKLVFKKDLGDGWYGYVYDLDVTVKDKKINAKDIIFSNGSMVTAELKQLKNGLDLKRKMHPTLDKRYYQDSHLIAGNKDAKHKLVLFSDPLCPICTDDVPLIIKDVQKYPKTFALYYISLPLDMHPTAKTLSIASKIAKYQGVKNVDYKVYTAGFEKYFDAYESKDDKKSLDAFNKVLKTNITMSQIKKVDMERKIQADIKLSADAFVNGTPTLFVDGEIDLTRSQYKKFIK